MEHRAFEEVSLLETNRCCNHKRNPLLKEIKQEKYYSTNILESCIQTMDDLIVRIVNH